MKHKLKITWLFTGILVFAILSCDDKAKKEISSTNDKTKVFKEELSDLEPDMTFNDAISVLEIIQDEVDYATFHKFTRIAYLNKKLDSIENVTIFAPVNSGFSGLSDSKLAELQSPDGIDELSYILQYHIVKDEYDFDRLKSTIALNENIFRLKTLNNRYIALTLDDDAIYITDENGEQSKIIKQDQEAENGVIHGINRVLLPQ